MCITVKDTSQQRCHICRCERKLLQELLNELPLLWMACVELAYSRTQSVQGSVCRCFQDLEKLCKAETTVWTLWIKARFIGYFCTRFTSAVSSALESLTSTTSTKRSVSGSPLASSTPRSHSPTWKRPAVVHTDRDARIAPTAKDPLRLYWRQTVPLYRW